jgi:hypothetical protein
MLGSSSKNPKHLDMEKKKQEISWKPNLENTIHVVYKGNRQKKQIQMFFTRLPRKQILRDLKEDLAGTR